MLRFLAMYAMDVEALIGKNVRRIRLEKGLTEQEVALRCEILTQGYMSNLESGRRNPTAVSLYLIASALGVEVGALYKTSGMPAKITDGPVIIRSKRSKRRFVDIQT